MTVDAACGLEVLSGLLARAHGLTSVIMEMPLHSPQASVNGRWDLRGRKRNHLNQMVETSPRTLPLNPMVKTDLRSVTDSKAEDIDCLGMTQYLWSL